jgi:hypothetical protein
LIAAWEAHDLSDRGANRLVVVFHARYFHPKGARHDVTRNRRLWRRFGPIADRAAAATSRESAGARAEPMTLALVNMAVQNQAHQATE